MNTFSELMVKLRGDSNSQHVPAGIADEYMKGGEFSYAYAVRKHGIKQSQAEFKKAVKESFGTLKPKTEVATSEITKEQFLELYEFAKFPTVRTWVSHIKKETGLYVNINDVHKWVLSSK